MFIVCSLHPFGVNANFCGGPLVEKLLIVARHSLRFNLFDVDPVVEVYRRKRRVYVLRSERADKEKRRGRESGLADDDGDDNDDDVLEDHSADESGNHVQGSDMSSDSESSSSSASSSDTSFSSDSDSESD